MQKIIPQSFSMYIKFKNMFVFTINRPLWKSNFRITLFSSRFHYFEMVLSHYFCNFRSLPQSFYPLQLNFVVVKKRLKVNFRRKRSVNRPILFSAKRMFSFAINLMQHPLDHCDIPTRCKCALLSLPSGILVRSISNSTIAFFILSKIIVCILRGISNSRRINSRKYYIIFVP